MLCSHEDNSGWKNATYAKVCPMSLLSLQIIDVSFSPPNVASEKRQSTNHYQLSFTLSSQIIDLCVVIDTFK